MTKPLHHIVLTLGIAFGALLSSCASNGSALPQDPMSVVRSGDVGPVLRNMQTISLHPRAQYVRGDDPVSEARVRATMQRVLLGWASARGLRWVRPEEAQVLVAFALGIEGRIDDEEIRSAFGVTAGLDLPGARQRGALVVALVDRRNKRNLWRGSVSGAREEGGTPEGYELDERLEKAVAVLLDGRPITQ